MSVACAACRGGQEALQAFTDRGRDGTVSNFITSSRSTGLGDALVVDADVRVRALSVGRARSSLRQEALEALAHRSSSRAIASFITSTTSGRLGNTLRVDADETRDALGVG